MRSPAVERLVALKANPQAALRRPWQYWRAPLDALSHAAEVCVGSGPVLAERTTISELPQLVSWPRDGGPFVTLPVVYTEDVREPGLRRSNLGMYRVQLAGNQYEPDREVGLHYQIHRSHRRAPRRGGARGPAVSRERVRRRAAGDGRRRGDAAARGDERAGLRRRARAAAACA